MKTVKCTANFCKWNKKGGVCTHPNAKPGIMNEYSNPMVFCKNYRKFTQKAQKIKV